MLLTVTDRHWLVVSEDNEHRASVVDCAFDDPLLVELTEVRHFGQLKIDFVAWATVQPHMNAFDTVADKLYRILTMAIPGLTNRTHTATIQKDPAMEFARQPPW
jgi:hypothetical protein